MPESSASSEHVVPYVHETPTTRALHFSLSAIQSRMDVRDPYALNLEYTRTMMGFLLFRPRPRHIAMIGLGGGSIAKFCHRHLPDARLDVVEINPHVIALREAFHVPPDDARFRVIAGDGAQFVRRRAEQPDVLMVDGFDSEGLPAPLCSQRFYDDCHAMLPPDGVLVVNLHGGHRSYARHLGRVQRSFEGNVLVVDDADRSNSIVFACKGLDLGKAGAGVVRRPAGLSRQGADTLLGAFARVTCALRDHVAAAGRALSRGRPVE